MKPLNMTKRPCGVAAFVLATSLHFIAHAERTFVGILEADSYQSVIYGASAFSQVADLPIAQDVIKRMLTQNLALPSFNGVSSLDLLRIVQTVDPAQPFSDTNPANVAVIPLADSGSTVLGTYTAAYATHIEKGPFHFFEAPSNTNLAARVAVAVSGRHLLTSTSREALVWAWDNRSRLIDAPTQTIPGTLRVFVNPQRLADILGTRSEKTSTLINLDKLIRDFESLSFSLTLEGQALSFTVRGKPVAQSPLQSLEGALRPPAEQLWTGVPEKAFFVSLSACANPALWNAYLGDSGIPLLRPVSDLAPQEAFSGDRVLYVAATQSKQGLCFVQIEPVTQADAVRQAIQKLHTAKKSDGIELVRRPTRQIAKTSIESYEVHLLPPAATADGKPSNPSLFFTLASVFLKQAILEVAVSDGYLITVLGPVNTLEDELPNLAFKERPLTLNRRIGAQNAALNDKLCLGASLNVADLLRHVVAIMPGAKPEHLRVLPAGGDGATFGIGYSADNRTLTASLSIQSNEIAALQRINRDGREVLQELFFQVFTSQMSLLKEPGVTAPIKQAP